MSVEMWNCHLPLSLIGLWQHWTAKRSLCTLTVLNGGVHLSLSLNDNIEQWRDHSVLWHCQPGGPSAFGVCIFIYALVCPYIFLLVDCFKWAFIYVSEQQKVHSVLWQIQMGEGPSVSESQWQHWTVKRSLCGLMVLTGGVHLPLTTLNSEEITLWSDSVEGGVHLPLSPLTTLNSEE